MHGNVQEWCNDWYRSLYCGEDCPDIDPVGPSWGETRVVRGGYFFSHYGECRSASRTESTPANASLMTGFRVAITD